MAPPSKGKTPTKGAKQILLENTSTVSFYRNMSLVSSLLYAVISFTLHDDSLTTTIGILLNTLLLIIYVGCHQILRYISQPKYSETGQLLDPGLDLNMEGGMGEHVKDIVILSSITHVLAAVSSYFWLLLLLIPIRAFWLVWVNILGPWFFQEAPKEQDEKKKKKLERRFRFQ